MRINKFTKFCFYSVTLIFTLCFGFIILSLFINHTDHFQDYDPLIIIPGLIIYALFLFLIFKLLEKFNFIRRKFFPLFMFIYVIIQILVIIFLNIDPDWDQGIVLDFASGNSDNSYLYLFQNNATFAYLFKLYLAPFKLIGVSDLMIPAMCLNAFILDIGIIFLYRTIFFFQPRSRKIMAFLLFSCLTLLLYIPVVYTDIIPFTSISILCYYAFYFYQKHYTNQQLNRKDIFHALFLGTALALGIAVKFTVIIALIAFIIVLFFKKTPLPTIKHLSFSLIPLALVFLFNHLFISSRFDPTILNRDQVPITHWVMMGLNQDEFGGYNAEDYALTFKSGDYQQKITFNLAETKNRFNHLLETNSLLDFYLNKTALMWEDGSLFIPGLLRLAVHKNLIHEFILMNGKFFTFYIYYTEITHIFALLLVFISPFFILKYRRKTRNNQTPPQPAYPLPYLFALIALIGYFLFFLIWESSSRYMFQFFPILTIVIYYTLEYIVSNILSPTATSGYHRYDHHR